MRDPVSGTATTGDVSDNEQGLLAQGHRERSEGSAGVDDRNADSSEPCRQPAGNGCRSLACGDRMLGYRERFWGEPPRSSPRTQPDLLGRTLRVASWHYSSTARRWRFQDSCLHAI